MRKMKWKRIAAMLVAVVMLCGAVGDWSFLVKAAEFSLSLASYQVKDVVFQLVPSNMDSVVGTYYKIPVTVDGTTDAYIVADKQESGYLAVCFQII